MRTGRGRARTLLPGRVVRTRWCPAAAARPRTSTRAGVARPRGPKGPPVGPGPGPGVGCLRSHGCRRVEDGEDVSGRVLEPRNGGAPVPSGDAFLVRFHLRQVVLLEAHSPLRQLVDGA